MNDTADFIEPQDKPQPETIETNIIYSELTAETIISDDTFEKIYLLKDWLKIEQAVSECEDQAKILKKARAFSKCWKAYKMQRAINETTDAAETTENNIGHYTEFDNQPLKLFCGEWITDKHSVFRMKQDAFGHLIKEKVSPIPILPTEIITNIGSNTEKVKLSFFKNNKWQSITVDRLMISSNNEIVKLASQGIEVTSSSAKLLVQYLSDLINFNKIPQVKGASNLGWIDGKTFIPYADNITYDGGENFKYLFESITETGSFETWQAMTAKIRNNLFVRLAMAASFASPIIKLLETLSFVVHLWGKTGDGKTICLRVSASIWGNSEIGKLVVSLNSTENNVLSCAAFQKNLPVFRDEMETIKLTRWETYDKLIYTFTEGVNRGRNHGNDSIAPTSWLCNLITSGEEPMIKFNSGGGASNRTVQMEVDKAIFTGNAAEVIECINNNYGAAGKKFITALINTGRSELKRIYKESFKAILDLQYTTDKQALSMAMILTADKIASRLFYPGEKPLTAEDIKEFLMPAESVDKSERAYTYIVSHIASNVNKFDKLNKSGEKITDDKNINHGEIWGYIQGNIVNFIKNIALRELSESGFEFDAVKKSWADKFYIIEDPGTAGRKKRYCHREMQNSVTTDYIKIKLSKEPIDEISAEDAIDSDLPL